MIDLRNKCTKSSYLIQVLLRKSCGKQYQMMASNNTSFAFFMSSLHILLLPHCTSVRSQHYTDNLISTHTCSCTMCVCICRIALCRFTYSAVMWTCPCLVDVMWTCDEVGWPFGLEERDVSPLCTESLLCLLPTSSLLPVSGRFCC